MALVVDGVNITSVICDGVSLSQLVCDGQVVWSSASSPYVISSGSSTIYIPSNRLNSVSMIGGGSAGGVGFNPSSGELGRDTTLVVYDALTNAQLGSFTAKGGVGYVGGANGEIGALSPSSWASVQAGDGYSDCNRTRVYGAGGKGAGAGGGASGGVNGTGQGGRSGSVVSLSSQTFAGNNGLKLVCTVGRGGSGNKSCGGSFPSQYVRQAGNGANGGIYLVW